MNGLAGLLSFWVTSLSFCVINFNFWRERSLYNFFNIIIFKFNLIFHYFFSHLKREFFLNNINFQILNNLSFGLYFLPSAHLPIRKPSVQKIKVGTLDRVFYPRYLPLFLDPKICWSDGARKVNCIFWISPLRNNNLYLLWYISMNHE